MSYCVTADRIHDMARRLQRVVDCQAFEREQRMGRLLDYPPEGVDAILRILDTEQRRTRRHNMVRRTSMCLGALLFLSLLPFVSEGTITILAILLLFCAVFTCRSAGATDRQIGAADTISRLGNELAIPPLIEILSSRDRRARRIAEESLVRLLPQLRRGDLLGERHLRILRRELSWQLITTSSDLMIAILRAMAVCRDPRSIRIVRGLAEYDPIIQKGRQVQAAAQSCLQALSANPPCRSENLLRAAESPQLALLRPTRGADNDPNLLRPASPDS